jgi:hypothetical protein
VKADGTFDCPIIPSVPDGTHLEVVIEDAAGNQTDPPVEIVTDGVAPLTPEVEPSNGGGIVGEVDPKDLDDAKNGDLVAKVIDPETGKVICETKVKTDGTFECGFEPPLKDGQEVIIKIEDPAGNESGEERIVIDATPPAPPAPKPSEGDKISGTGEDPGNKITVTDKDGNVICETVIRADKTWECELKPPAKVGDILKIEEEDPAKNKTVKPWRVGIPEVAVAKPRLYPNDPQTATGINFQPGETVKAVTLEGGAAKRGLAVGDEFAVGTATADANGQVVFDWRIPQDAVRDVHTLVLRGAVSGNVSDRFTVLADPQPVDPPKVTPELPFTGADGIVGMVGGALGLALAGWLLLLAARRRREAEDQAKA